MQQKENTVPIIEPVARELLLAELTPARKMRNTHRAGNEIYIFYKRKIRSSRKGSCIYQFL